MSQIAAIIRQKLFSAPPVEYITYHPGYTTYISVMMFYYYYFLHWKATTTVAVRESIRRHSRSQWLV